MQLNRRQAERIFAILGVVPKKSTHHVAGYVEIDDVRVLQVHYSRSSSEYSVGFAHRFRKSLHLSVPEFLLLRDGRMTRDEYVKIIRDRVPRDTNY